jgi:acetyltransferase-like isoleucine patch superfamily enzyme
MVVVLVIIRIIRRIVLRLFNEPLKLMNRLNALNKIDQCSCAAGVIFLPVSRVENAPRDPKKITIGKKTVICGQLSVLNHGGEIDIGESCFIGESSRIWSTNKITIGNNVLISHNVNIHDHNSHSLSAEKRHQHFVDIFSTGHPDQLEDVPSKPISIGNDVWIGFNANILKGVTIGEGAVIGACTLITHDVEPYTIVVGNPARVVGESRK